MPNLKETGDTGDRMMQGLPYGQGGAVSGASSLDTFSSPDASQPDKFDTLTDKSNLTASEKTMNQVAPFSTYSSQDPKDYNKDVNAIKTKVTPDEVIAGIDYEMKKLVLKDKNIAKQNVVKNLKEDPKYYSKLNMLDIDDGKEDNKEKSTEVSDYRTPQEKAIAEVMRDLYKKKLERRNWH